MNAKRALKTLILAALGGSFALTALAQWQWIDKDGRNVFSDRSPPAEIQEKNILKRPGSHQVAAVPASASTAASPTAAASAAAGKGNAPKLSGKDAQLEARKKQAEEVEAAKKKAEEENVAKARADNCEHAKGGLVNFQSGLRISVTNAKGEREVMDDNARAAETKRLQGIADSDCK
ncbi:MAG TPA: DUF4124 domain-containing protein [Polaromonas sp.]|uniref:DUF4124 domain-containing protein n=1 Tax=Polaromonas sp. UBA4122 TaxID=1947074 RepID=UPI000EE84BE1|nr:DUF4124 domain-containing protein [Polaromonas sp. UBA4122]HAL38923.1 DUF4124 domain-containing protein [Polaromonas sp.]